jgi:hypothetical protein
VGIDDAKRGDPRRTIEDRDRLAESGKAAQLAISEVSNRRHSLAILALVYFVIPSEVEESLTAFSLRSRD